MEAGFEPRTAPVRLDVVLDSGEGFPMSFGLDPIEDVTWAWLSDRLLSGALPVTFGVPELDTEGHAIATDEVVVDLYVEDDVEGHAVRLRFATKEEAGAFRRSVLAAGRLGGSLSVDHSRLSSAGTARGRAGRSAAEPAG